MPSLRGTSVCAEYLFIYSLFMNDTYRNILILFFMLFENISPCYERPPVLRDHLGLAEGVVSQDRDHCIHIDHWLYLSFSDHCTASEPRGTSNV